MDAKRFDRWTRLFAASRRSVVRGLAGSTLAAVLGNRLTAPAAAACLADRGRCTVDGDCCSGNCPNGRCICRAEGEACARGNQCCSNLCKRLKCRCPDTSTGSVACATKRSRICCHDICCAKDQGCNKGCCIKPGNRCFVRVGDPDPCCGNSTCTDINAAGRTICSDFV